MIEANPSKPTRSVHHGDAIAWLEAVELGPSHAIITSMPDVSELPVKDLSAWKLWFQNAARLCLARLAPESVAIFFQTDIKAEGAWVDKGFLVQCAAQQESARLLWHKVVCRAPPSTVTFGRPAYSHMLCFSKELPLRVDRSTADVIPAQGRTLWTRGMGVEACRIACEFVRRETACTTIVDPFCGVGTTLAVANALGFHALGVELSRKRAARAEALQLPVSE